MRSLIALFISLLLGISSLAEERFTVSGELKVTSPHPAELSLAFGVPAAHHLYADKILVRADSVQLSPKTIPPAKRKYDATLEAETAVYDEDFTQVYSVTGALPSPLSVTVEFQGCSESICFMPETRTLSLVAGAAAVTPLAQAPHPKPEAAGETTRTPAIQGRASGYLPPAEFLAFLDAAAQGVPMERDRLAQTLETRGLWLTLILILLGGLALNLTPCVLPMIPINIAIIGAGAQSGSRGRGFALGTAYGFGIALVYGVLGLFVVLTGAKFGTLNASPWFNLGIAVLFAALSLGMFDIITIDFSRFQSLSAGESPRKGGFGLALFMGGIAALLAGACVAPVVISVLILAADLYARQNPAGLLLPFFLGLGMALPWPFAGAGLSFLPKPGRWMNRVKYVFGLLILIFAGWYAYLGVSLLRDRAPSAAGELAAAQSENAQHGGWFLSMEQGLAEARRTGKPVLIDFWATWCKNCLKMEKTTFKDPAVAEKLKSFVPVKFQAEDMRAPGVKLVLDQYGVLGLPTYVVLRVPPESSAPAEP